jgi:hypothetical protein
MKIVHIEERTIEKQVQLHVITKGFNFNTNVGKKLNNLSCYLDYWELALYKPYEMNDRCYEMSIFDRFFNWLFVGYYRKFIFDKVYD